MNAQDFRSLQEAYMEVYNELDEEQSTIPRGTPMNKRWPYISNKDPDFQTAVDRVNKKKSKKTNEEVDIYDIILSHLLDEGYAETPEAAEVIMVNMSEEWRESIVEEMLDEGMDMKTFKANRKKTQRAAATADARKRGHEGSEWHNTGRTYGTDEAKSRRANLSDTERSARHGVAVDPDSPEGYGVSKTKNPRKLRKQQALGEH
jgi:hypothetical protein